jgi:1,2-diacylglycerol 3-alpha-glucosyltransferase
MEDQMKILICTHEFPPYASGIGYVVKNVANEFKKKNHECVICSPTGPDIILGNRWLIDKFGGFGIIYFWYCLSKYFRKEKKEYDLIWLHHPTFISKCPFDKMVVTMHTTYIGFYIQSKNLKSALWKKIYYYMMNIIERNALVKIEKKALFTSVSKSVIDELRIYNIKSKITLIQNGVNIDQFHPRPNKNEIRHMLKIPNDKILFLWVGRMIYVKRPDILIEVFYLLQKEIDNLFLVIAGEGELFLNTKKLAVDYGLENVIFLGHVNQDILSDIYACSDYYIMTSSYEGQPLTLLEATASGLLPIVSNIRNLSNLIYDMQCGCVADFSDIKSASQKIVNYIKDNDKCSDCSTYIKENMSWEECADKYVKLVASINK